MYAEPLTECCIPNCYSKPVFAGLCAVHCTKSENVEASLEKHRDELSRIFHEKVKEMPDLTPKQANKILPNDIVSVSIDNPGRRGSDTPMSVRYPKYYRPIPAGVTEMDIYAICKMFNVNDAALSHALKKLMLPGDRTGGKSRKDDIKEARDTLTRWLDLNQ